MDFEEFVRLLEQNDGQHVQVLINPEGPLRASFIGELWHDKQWEYDTSEDEPEDWLTRFLVTDDPTGRPTDDDLSVVIACRVGDVSEAGGFVLKKSVFVDATVTDERTILITTTGSAIEIETNTDRLRLG